MHSRNSTLLGTLFQAGRVSARAAIGMTPPAGSRVLISSHRPGFALDLGAVHDTPRGGVEGIAAVHHAAVVPQNEVADTPIIVPGELVAGRVSPDLVEQRFGIGER